MTLEKDPKANFSPSYNNDDYDDDVDSIDANIVNADGEEAQDKDESIENKLAAKETKLVNRSKIAVCFVVLLAAAATGTATYLFMEKEEVGWYEDEFEEFSEEIFETCELKVEQSDVALKLLADEYTSLGETESGGSIIGHANVTHPQFSIRANRVQQLVGGSITGFAPLVHNWQKTSWEAYAIENQDWIEEALAMEGITEEPGEIPATIYPHDNAPHNDALESTIYFPIWQVFPTPMNASSSPVMLDLYSVPLLQQVIDKVISTRHAAITPVQDLEFLLHYENISPMTDPEHESEDEDTNEDHEASMEHSKDGEGHDGHSPITSLFLEPVFAAYNEQGPVIGIVFSFVDWQVFLSGILEDEAEGMVIDLENTCDSSRYSFYVTDNDDVKFLGDDFEHDPDYFSMSERSALDGSGEESSSDSSDRRRILQESSEDPQDSSDHDGIECGFYVSTHATGGFVDNWERNTTVLYTIVVVSIFLFTGMIFLIYDWLVQRRQEKVMDTAEKTTAIVSSLFPKEVRDRMMAEQAAASKRIRNFAFREESNKESTDSAPIADLFEETTIMFADLVGFTKWSSSREPCEVFRLLETIYGSFDQIAEDRGVFKVETIGDCYVAVCGLPEPNKNHSIVMARFANDCLAAIERSTRSLVDELGADTADLKIRIGLHSGSVTAGVLRGRRARFQLFGDSVNTTARIESTGRSNMIHVSQALADNLSKFGKSHWLRKREEKVVAKGLGEIDTYWLQVKTTRASSTASCESTSSAFSTTHIVRPQGYVPENQRSYLGQNADTMSDIRTRLHSRLANKREQMMSRRQEQELEGCDSS